MGKDNSTVIVSKVVVDTSFLKGTANGLRVKIWQVILFLDRDYPLSQTGQISDNEKIVKK